MRLSPALKAAQRTADAQQHPVYVWNTSYPNNLDVAEEGDPNHYYVSAMYNPERDVYTVVPR
jgi:hypothetical protein